MTAVSKHPDNQASGKPGMSEPGKQQHNVLCETNTTPTLIKAKPPRNYRGG